MFATFIQMYPEQVDALNVSLLITNHDLFPRKLTPVTVLLLENIKHGVSNFWVGMEILAIRKQGNTRVTLKKGINFNNLYKPIRLADATTEESTKGLKRRKMGNLKLQTTFSFKLYLLLESDNSGSKEEGEDLPDKQNPPELMFSTFVEQEVAATKLQKVYKSYRTRRILADCAVLCEELWFVSYPSLWLFVFFIFPLSMANYMFSFRLEDSKITNRVLVDKNTFRPVRLQSKNKKI